MTFQDTAVNSSLLYYQFLNDNQKGVVENKVKAIVATNDCFNLHVYGKLQMPDQVFIKIKNEIYNQEQIKAVRYDNEQRILTVRPLNSLRSLLQVTSPKDIIVISDLKFLVKRVGNWYKSYGEKLSLPNAIEKIEYKENKKLTQLPSDEQEQAINGALSEPFSYIWGAPGTGKTRFVLARCILSYIQAKKRVLITAPTNNAVEQTLLGVLAVMEEAGVPLDSIMRLGVPSSDFYECYPSLCEDTATSKKLVEINDNILTIDSEIKDITSKLELYEKYKLFLDFKDCFENFEVSFSDFSKRVNRIQGELKRLFEELSVTTGKETVFNAELNKETTFASSLSVQISYLNQQVNKYSKGLRKHLFPKKYSNYLYQLTEKLSLFSKSSETVSTLNNQISLLKEQRNQLEQKHKEYSALIIDEVNSLKETTSFWPEFHSELVGCTSSDIEQIFCTVTDYINNGKRIVEDRTDKYSSLANASEDEYVNRITLLSQRKKALNTEREETEKSGIGAHIDNCLVVAATVDSCLSRIPPGGDFIPRHVFLDEAGYCSLIKATTLFAYNCPVAFLGDHMQLPPVCEMNDDLISLNNYLPIALWAQSALYCEDTFFLQPLEICKDYINHTDAKFDQMKKHSLTHSFRFGESLATVLSSYIYQNNFHGDTAHETDIFYINSPKIGDNKKRVSISECSAIKNYVSTHNNEDIGIITPYTMQRNELKLIFRTNPAVADEITTVHGSQGREWDTVLFSVVDKKDMWFTNSLSIESKGKFVINTAVSRAKKKLIIICDADFWRTQQKQLIGQLINVAQELSDN